MIRVLTCNLFSGRGDLGHLASFVESNDVDVLCAQELDGRRADRLTRVLPYGQFSSEGVNRDLGIFCRYRARFAKLSLAGRDGWGAQLSPADWTELGEHLEILNVHIFAPHTWPYFPRRERRRDQLSRLLAFLDADAQRSRAILGDFNATPSWPVYKRLASRFSDAAKQPSMRPRATWPNVGGRHIPGLLRIDHCFVTPKVHCERVEVLDIPGSDHYGLCVDLEVASKPQP